MKIGKVIKQFALTFSLVLTVFINLQTANAQVVVVPFAGDAEGITFSAVAPIEITTPNPNKPDEQVISFIAPADQEIDNMQPSLGLNYVIALQGVFPSRNMSSNPYLAGISLFGGNFAPRGWAFCSGQLLPIAQNTALFSLLGTTYGGDGRTTFGLPDLRGRVAVGSQGNQQGPGLTPRILGSRFGVETNTVDHQ